MWRRRIFAITCLVVSAALVVVAINQWSHGQPTIAAVIAVLIVGTLLLPIPADDERSLSRSSLVLVVMGFAFFMALSLFRGGLRSQVPMGLATVPALAGILLGTRAMVVWAGLAIAGIVAMGVVPARFGLALVDRLSVRGQEFSQYLAPILITVLFCGLIRMMLRLQGDALDNARVAERARVNTENAAARQRTEQMAMVGQLAVGVAHEVNNPLSYVVANVEFAAARLREQAEPQWLDMIDALADAADGARRIGRIVTQLSAHGRAEEERVEPVRLRECVETALRIAHNQLRHRAQIEREFGVSPVVDADANRLTQVFLNILINAAHAIPVGDREANKVAITIGLDDEQQAYVDIADTGEGIDPEVLPRIAEPFFTTKEVGNGTGLGLSISHAIVGAYGGRLEITSEIGVGTRVRVRLPTSGGVVRSTHDGELGSDTDLELGRVLIIDDDEPVRMGLARSLPANVVTAGDVREALEIIEDDDAFDAIVCDVMMPDLTGLDFYEALEHRWPHLLPRLLFLTGGVFDAEALAFLHARDVTVLTKPLLRRELVAAIEELLDG